jgi:hypothetical protein
MGSRLTALALAIATSMAWPGVARAADKAACLKAYESAQQDKNEGKLRSSREALLVCVEPECPDLLRKDCSSWLTEVERSMPTVVVTARSGKSEVTDVRVWVDDALLAQALTGAALELDPGPRAFRIEAPGYVPVERSITIRQGEKNRVINVELAPVEGASETSRGIPLASWVLGGIGVVGLASFSYFGLKGLSGRGDLNDCKGECAQSDVDDVHSDFTRADISLAIGALALGGAVYFYLSAPGSKSEGPAQASLGVSPRRGGAETAIRLRF